MRELAHQRGGLGDFAAKIGRISSLTTFTHFQFSGNCKAMIFDRIAVMIFMRFLSLLSPAFSTTNCYCCDKHLIVLVVWRPNNVLLSASPLSFFYASSNFGLSRERSDWLLLLNWMPAYRRLSIVDILKRSVSSWIIVVRC